MRIKVHDKNKVSHYFRIRGKLSALRMVQASFKSFMFDRKAIAELSKLSDVMAEKKNAVSSHRFDSFGMDDGKL